MKKMKMYIEKIIANHMNVWKKGHGSYSGACSNFALHYGVSFAMSFCGALATLGEFTGTDIFETLE